MMRRKSLTALIGVLMLLACLSVYAEGEQEAGAGAEEMAGAEFPSRPIDIVVPSNPGGTTDVSARALAATASPYLNDVDINVVNMPGGQQMVGIEFVLQQTEPDGYTLVVGYGVHYKKTLMGIDLPIDAHPVTGDLQPVIGSLGYTSALVVPYDSPFETLEDLVEYAKDNPGELSWGHTGANGTHDIMGKTFLASAGIDAVAVPLSGGPATRQAVTGGHVDFGVLATFLVPDFVRDSLMRPLAIFAPEGRDPLLPDVPTFRELGYDDVFDLMDLKLIGASADVPEERIQILYEGFKQATETAAFKQLIEAQGLIPLGWSPEETLEAVQEYNAAIQDLLDAGILQPVQ